MAAFLRFRSSIIKICGASTITAVRRIAVPGDRNSALRRIEARPADVIDLRRQQHRCSARNHLSRWSVLPNDHGCDRGVEGMLGKVATDFFRAAVLS